jgi:hypothetical protein
VDNGRVKPTVMLPIGAVLLLALAGCVPQSVDPSGTPTPSTSSAPTGTPTATATPSGTPDPAAEPITFGCDEFVTPQEMYDYNSIFAEVGTAPSGALAAQALASGGIACVWMNTSSGATIEFSVATPSPQTLESLRGSAGTPASSFDGFFDGHSAQVFDGDYWVTVTSDELLSDQDAAPLVDIAVNALP